MIKILVVSDTHGNRSMLQRCIDESLPFEVLIHCGDGLNDVRSADIPDGITVLAVAGNTDAYSYRGDEKIIKENISGKEVMITHGHIYNVKSGLLTISKAAGDWGAELVIFGHTHRQLLSMENPVLFNPGDLSTGSYGIIHISEKGEWSFDHRKMKKI